MAYCNSYKGNPNNPIPGFFIGFRVQSLNGDTFNVVDLNGNVPMNLGKRIDDINTQEEPSDTSRAKLRIAGGIDSLEFWYFGPFQDGDTFDIVLIDHTPDGICDTIEVASGTFTCQNQDPNACDANVPLYYLDFSQSEWNIGGGESSNESFDEVFLIMQRPRVATCCHVGNDRCFEFIITLDEDDIGLQIDDVGSGSTAGFIYADSLNGFMCGTNQANTWPYTQGGGQSADEPLCIGEEAREWIVLSCKEGNNVTGVSFGTVGEINVLPEYVYEDCTVNLEVLNATNVIWSSPNDSNLVNLISFSSDSAIATFSYDENIFGPVTSCAGDTFTYYVGGNPDNDCLLIDSIYYDTTFVVVYPSFLVGIDSTCLSADSTLLEAVFITNAQDCGYQFIWSTGDTTTSIIVPNTTGDYSVRVLRPDLDSLVDDCSPALDAIHIEPVTIVCPPDMNFNCISSPPSADVGLVDIGGCGLSPFVYYFDSDNGGSGCGLDPLIINRNYIVDFDGDTINTTTDRDTCVQLFTYVDNLPPSIICPLNITIACGSPTLPDSTGGYATATDNCDTLPDISYTDIINGGSCPQEYTISRTWVATDDCGNARSCVQIISIEDNIPPLITCPANLTIDCLESTSPAITGSATGSDNCDTLVAISFSTASSGGCPVYTRTWTATDDCGNSTTCTQTITLIDTIAPVLTCPADITVECGLGTNPATTGNATSTDACDAAPIVVYTDIISPGSCPQNFIIERTWSASDDCGNARTCLQIISVIDTIPPSINCPADVTLECGDNTLPAQTGNGTAIDNCDLSSAVSFSDVVTPGSCPAEQDIERTWVATDACGNSATCVQYITVRDEIPPLLTCPANLTILCDESSMPSNTGWASATDNCDLSVLPIYTDSLESGTCQMLIIRTWQATDSCGNSSACVQTILVPDEPPVVNGNLPSQTIEGCVAGEVPAAAGTVEELELLGLSITDVCTGDSMLAVTSIDVISGECPVVVTRTYSITDGCLNTSTAIQVFQIDDTTPPSITGSLAAITVEGCDAGDAPSAVTNVADLELLGLAVSDACAADSSLVVTNSDDITGTCPVVMMRIYTVTDACLNATTVTQTIEVIDSTPPSVTGTIEVTTIEGCAAGDAPPAVTSVAALEALGLEVSDTCTADTLLTVISSDSGTGTCPVVVTRTYTVIDACLNSTTTIQIINVEDSTPPSVTGSIATSTVEGCEALDAPAAATNVPELESLGLSIGDACTVDSSLLVTSVDTSTGACPVIVTRTYTVTDECLNTTTVSQTIHVDDTTSPLITCPPDITIVYPASTLPSNTGNLSATDNCDTLISITYSDSLSPPCSELNIIIRTWTAVDDCGNASSCEQTILISDHGTICGMVEDDLGQPLAGITIQLHADNNTNEIFDAGDTLFATVVTDSVGNYCFTDIKPCNYILVEVQPLDYGDLFDYDISPDPDGNDSLDGPDNQIPVILGQVELDSNNNFIDIVCPTLLPVIPPDTICSGDSVIFETVPMNPGPLNYLWDFGSGSTPSTAGGLGPHMVSYTGTPENLSTGAVITFTISKEGCPDLSGQVSTVKVNANADATINGSTANLCYYTDRVFQPAAPEIPGATYNWNFGANAVPLTATGYGPHTVYYTVAGTKTVSLSIYPNEPGAQCPDSSSIMFNVTNCPGNITGFVKDVNGDPIQGVNLKLFKDNNLDGLADDNVPVRNTFTTPAGTYSMVGLTPGSYVVIQTQPQGWYSVNDEDITEDFDLVTNIDSLDNLIPSTVNPGEIDGGNNFTESAVPGSIHGVVFNDLNNNELPNSGEGLENVLIKLFSDADENGVADSNIPVDSTFTDASGNYTFIEVPIGSYVLSEIQPAGVVSVMDIDATEDLDTVPNTNLTDDLIPVTIENEENDDHNYFIEQFECTLLVINTDDSGSGSFRFMLNCAANSDTIRFDTILEGDTIFITSSRFEIDKDLVILSECNPRLTIASEIPGLFDIAPGREVTFEGMDIISGLEDHPAAAFYNFGLLILNNIHLFRNPALPPGNYLITNAAGSELSLHGDCMIMQN